MNHSGVISTNETWALADSPHYITGNITQINSGAVVTVEAGCTIIFNGDYYILATSTGTFNCEGTAAAPITITSSAGSPAKGDWNYLQDQIAQSHLRYCNIRYGDKIRGFGEITNCNIGTFDSLSCEIFGIYNTTIENNTFYDLNNICLYIQQIATGKTVSIKNNLVYDTNGKRPLYLYDAGDIDGTLNIINNTFYGNSAAYGIYLYNADGTGTVNIRNNILVNFTIGINQVFGSITFNVDYNDYYNCSTNTVGTGGDGANSITTDPQFADATPVNTDEFRLKSVYGRWDGSGWVKDGSTSPCVSTGNPGDSYVNEPVSSRINMGFDGNTIYASYDALPPATSSLEISASVAKMNINASSAKINIGN